MGRVKEISFWLVPLLIILSLLVVTLFVDSSMLVAPLAAFLWLLVAKEKGYFAFGALLFVITGILFAVYPVFWTGFAMVASLVALSCIPARKKDRNHWRVASKDGTIRSWLLPRNGQEDIGAVVGDASIHIIAIAFLMVPIILL